MPVAVISPGRREEKDPLDKLAQALNIARTGFGIYTDLKGIEDLKARRDAEAEQKKKDNEYKDLQIEAAKREQANAKDDDNPNSPLMQSIRQAAKARGITLPEGTTPRQARTNFDAFLKPKDPKAGDPNGPGKMVPAGDVMAIGSADASFKALDDAQASINDNKDIVGPYQGRLSGLAANFEVGETGKKAKALNAKLRANAQSIGKYLEGGKLTDSDIKRYEAMLPNLNDSPEAAAQKTEVLKGLIAERQASEIQALKSGGYNTGSLSASGSRGQAPAQGASKSGPSLEDLMAEKERRKKANATASR